MKQSISVLLLLLLLLLTAVPVAQAQKPFRIAWSHYTGWEPWEYARHAGILDRWAEKYGIAIRLELINDYIESINLYTGGTYDGCTMTNMDALTIPAVGGIDSTALIIGDFSNGNDGIVIKEGTRVPDLKGRRVMLVELSVSHYLLARALNLHNMTERDLILMNTSDADIAALFASDSKGAVVTWNPPLMQCRNVKGANLVFDSSQIPGEIIDLMVVRSNTPDSLKKALTGAWYDTMAIMNGKGRESREALQYMASFAGATEAEFKAQLRTTAMFYEAAEAAAFARSPQLKTTMDSVRQFSFSHGLFGDADTVDRVGIQFPDGEVLGDSGNIKLRFDATFMELAAEGKL